MSRLDSDAGGEDELKLLTQWLEFGTRIAALKKQARDAEAELDALAYARYPKLMLNEVQSLAVTDKWMAALEGSLQGELDRVSQTLTGRIRELAERYATPLPKLTNEVTAVSALVEAHLASMGASCN